jgi:probable F420-dependent oxidoreductase
MDLTAPLPPLGPIGVFSWEGVRRPAAEVRLGVRAIEDLGFSTIWFPESRGREAMTAASLVLEATESVAVATGIASIWARDPMSTAFAAYGLGEAHPGRFLLGLGVSHAPSAQYRGRTYDRPLGRMSDYLDGLARMGSPLAVDGPDVPVVLAALGPKMLEMAGTRTAGAHPYFVPVGHTVFARGILGAGPFLAPEQAVVVEGDPARARAIARAHTTAYLGLDNYRRNLERLGWTDRDLEDGGSDTLVDAVVAWGDAATVADRVRAHLDAGADHVSLLVLTDDEGFPLPQLEALAAELL